MFYLQFLFSREDFVSVAHQIGDDCIAVVASGRQYFAIELHRHWIARFFVLFHHIPDWTFGIFGGIFIVDEHLSAHGNGNDSSQILVSFIVDVIFIAAPKRKASDCMVVLLEIFHSRAVSYVDCEDLASAVADK